MQTSDYQNQETNYTPQYLLQVFKHIQVFLKWTENPTSLFPVEPESSQLRLKLDRKHQPK